MPPQSPEQPAPERGRRGERRDSGRAQRKAAAEQAARRKQLALLGGAIAEALVVALALILANRPQDTGAPILAAPPLDPAVPVAGMTMGNPEAPVAVVEWGDYT